MIRTGTAHHCGHTADLPTLERAACFGRDDIEWVPDMETLRRNDFEDNRRRALEVCQDCPVREPCLTFAVTTNQKGIWGMTDDDQRKARRRANLAASLRGRA